MNKVRGKEMRIFVCKKKFEVMNSFMRISVCIVLFSECILVYMLYLVSFVEFLVNLVRYLN